MLKLIRSYLRFLTPSIFGIDDMLMATAGPLAAGLLQYDSADKAADANLAGVNAGIGEQRRQYEQNRTDLAPYRDVGTGALYQLRDMTKPGGYLMSDYTGASLESDPGYKFGLDQGQRAIDQSAASRGILFSGKTLKDLMRFGQDYGGTKFNEGFQRDMATKGFRQNALSGLSGTGMAATGNTAALGQSSANTIADLAGSGGSARAAGIVGGANALAGSFQNAGNNYMQMSMLDRIMGRGVGSGAVPNGSAGNNWSYV